MAPSNKALITTVNKRSFVVTLRIIIRLFGSSFLKGKKSTVEPPFATTSRKRPPLFSDHFSKIQKVFKFNYYRWNLSLATTSRKRPPLFSDHFSKIQKVFKFNYYRWNLSLATTSRKRPPLFSDHFSKIQKVFKFNYYRWNLSLATTSRKRALLVMVSFKFSIVFDLP